MEAGSPSLFKIFKTSHDPRCHDFEISHHCKWSAGYSKHSLLGNFRTRRYCLASKSVRRRTVIDFTVVHGAEKALYRAKDIVFKNMTDNSTGEDAESSGKNQQSESNLTELLTDGFMEAFAPNLENLQERLGELT